MKTLSVPEYIAGLIPYPPGKPIEELERELGIKGSIKLASNENPLGPSPKAAAALGALLKDLHRYPDGSCYYLKEKLSARLDMPACSLIIGNGSNEIIELLVRTYLRPCDEVVMGCPSFAVYPIVTQAAGAIPVRIPLTRELVHDLDKMAESITERTRIIFIANPNNPTGTVVTQRMLDGFLQDIPEDIIVSIDEAYFEYAS
ncbi:MAG: aminotransferase class I/II-fold pyridoxal phosphate-dependent enzyme, partial [Deltaproteobacteria bacterium]|nr:aminotransferase class I/II-fold pyridoxal phosphate-dependent enzyme [Deltaproteobacteria bacterium]